MTSRRLQAAKRLADAHFDAEPDLQRVFVLEAQGAEEDGEPIRLLEVVEGSFSQDIFPIGFPASPAAGIDFPSVIVEVTPSVWTELRDRGALEFRGKRWLIGEELKRTQAVA